MILSVMFDPISRTGLVSVQGGMNEKSTSEVSPLLDQFLMGLCMQGWTFLLGRADGPPRVLDPQTALRIIAQQYGSAANPSSQPQPEISPDIDILSDPERPPERHPDGLSGLFRSWMPKDSGSPPGPDEPKPDSGPPSEPS